MVKASQVTVSSPEESHLEFWKGHGCQTTFQNGDVIQSSELVMWATKPQYFQQALKETQVKDGSIPNRFHVSIMAGFPLDSFSASIASHLKCGSVRAARVMPNIAMRVGSGVSGMKLSRIKICGYNNFQVHANMHDILCGHKVYTMNKESEEADKSSLVKLLSSVGLCYEVPEVQINAYCGLFASGIGFVSGTLWSALKLITSLIKSIQTFINPNVKYVFGRCFQC